MQSNTILNKYRNVQSTYMLHSHKYHIITTSSDTLQLIGRMGANTTMLNIMYTCEKYKDIIRHGI